MHSGIEVTKYAIPEIVFGKHSLKYVVPCAKRNGAKKVLLVSDGGLRKVGWVEKLIDILEQGGLKWVYFDDVDSNPRDYQIRMGAEFYLEQNADVIIALGGGSPMDTAKGIALIASNGGEISDYEGVNRIQRPLPPMIFIPTTAGSGADISQFAIITDVHRQVKMAIISRTLVPNISIIDPMFLKTKPKWLIVASAVDALSHAIEAYVSVLSSPFTEMNSLKAIELIVRVLSRSVKSKSLSDLSELSTASTAAGMAFSNTGLGVDHAIAHSLGGKYDIMHGLLHPILLPEVMRFNLEAALEKMSTIGSIVSGRREHNHLETARTGIKTLEEFFSSFEVPVRLRDVVSKVEKNGLKEACHMSVQDACVLTNPRKAGWQDCLQICEEVW